MRIRTSIGVFHVTRNDKLNGITLYTEEGNFVKDMANVPYWDKNKIFARIYAEEKTINENIADPNSTIINALTEKVVRLENELANKFEINRDNILTILEKTNELLHDSIKDKTYRGFVCSRLTQVINKLETIKI